MRIKHGHLLGGNITPEYRAYQAAKTRCRNQNHVGFPRYGGRGIEFRFESFEEFFSAIGPKPSGMTVDRIDNGGHYEPGNVRWATRKEQIANRKRDLDFERNGRRTLYLRGRLWWVKYKGSDGKPIYRSTKAVDRSAAERIVTVWVQSEATKIPAVPPSSVN